MSMEYMEENKLECLEDANDSEKEWVVEMEESLMYSTPDNPDDSDDGRIHKVPKSLLRKETWMFYIPQVVFLGPYHFKGIEKKNDEMELLKTEIARNVHFKLKKKGGDETQKVKEKEGSSVDVGESGLKSAIQIFKESEEKIKKSYAEEFKVTGEVLAWMIARDACFVRHVLQRFRQDEVEETESASINRTLGGKRYHPLMTDIVKDVLKMENQLPLWALEEISPHENEEWLVSALKNLSPINVANVRKSREYNERSHILKLLRDYIVDRQQSSASSSAFCCESASDILACVCESACDWFSEICCEFEWNDLPRLFRPLVCLGYYFIWTIFLIVLSPVRFVMFIMFIIFLCSGFVTSEWENVLTVEELKKLGVKFERLKRRKRGISHIKFKSSTLYLPQFKVDNRSEVILRNLIALEICSKEEEKPITSYAIMMNDLINTREDVAILRGEDIIINKLGSDEDVAKLWNSLVPSTEGPSYPPIDNVVSGINSYRKKRWKILWAQFVMTHCSKPWLLFSLLAGLILLVLTLLQTICLFLKCQAK